MHSVACEALVLVLLRVVLGRDVVVVCSDEGAAAVFVAGRRESSKTERHREAERVGAGRAVN